MKIILGTEPLEKWDAYATKLSPYSNWKKSLEEMNAAYNKKVNKVGTAQMFAIIVSSKNLNNATRGWIGRHEEAKLELLLQEFDHCIL